MKLHIISFLIIYLSLIVIDGIWLSFTVSKFYRLHLNHLWIENISYLPALALYFIYALAITLVLVMPGLSLHYHILKVFILGAVFGLAAYGCYDITNQATLKGWPFIVTIVDMAWGAFVTGASASIGYKITSYFQ